VLCHGRNTDGESHRFTGDANPEDPLSKVSLSESELPCISLCIPLRLYGTPAFLTVHLACPIDKAHIGSAVSVSWCPAALGLPDTYTRCP